MRDSGLILGAVLILGLAGGGAWLYLKSAGQVTTQPAGDTPGPNLVIELGGAAQGTITIDLLPEAAPGHVDRITALAEDGAYDGVVFHRVIDGFMAQTGDVEHGQRGGDLSGAGTGASDLPDLAAEFSNIPFRRGTVGMARSASPDSANSQFFIMFDAAGHLNGKYTVVGRVIDGMDAVDSIKKGDSAQNGVVASPDYMETVSVTR